MRYRILASFQGAPYEAGVGPDEGDVVLFAACPPPEELRFEPATGHWRKRVSRTEVQTLYESRPVGTFRGERCVVLDDLSDRLHIVYQGHDALRAAQLGYWEVDRGVFELITPRHEVTDIVEQRIPLPIRSDSGEHTRPGPMPSDRLDDHGPSIGNGRLDQTLPGTDQLAKRSDEAERRDELMPGTPLYDQPGSPLYDRPGSPLYDRQSLYDEQSRVTIPPVAPPPLPLEAEALRATSSAARRGQKGGQARQTQDARGTRRAQPIADAEPPAPPAAQPQAPVAPAQAQAQPQQAQPQQAQPQGMLSKAAMLSHAAATAPRQAPAPSQPEQQTVHTAVSQQTVHTAVSQESQEPESGQAQVDAAEQAMALLPDEAATPRESTTPDQPDPTPPATSPADITPADTVLADTAVPDTGLVDTGLVDTTLAATALVDAALDTALIDAALADTVLADTVLADTVLADTVLADTVLAETTSRSAEPEPVQIASAAGPSSATDTAPHRSGADHPGVGISDPPGISQPVSPPVVPSWMPGQAGHYGPYVPDQSPEHNGVGAQPALAEPTDQVPANAHQVPANTDQVQANAHQVPANTDQIQANTDQVQPAVAAAAPTRRRRATKRRLPTQKIFSELATQAAIPAEAYAISDEVDGAMCLVRTDEGFEVFNSSGGARHEVRVFQDEESAYFYLFGVLVAESVRTGALIPRD